MLVRRSSLLIALLALGGCTDAPPRPADQEETPPATEEHTEPPVPSMRLTTGDGTGLELVNLEVRGVVQGPLGFTELHLTFENPEDRTLAGQFVIDLPPGAALSRFAMKIDGQWQEGEVVERQSARKIYDQFLHNNVDPALLQKQSGNRFSAKVFPIPARGRKELVLSYSQVLDGHAAYRVPLRGLPQLEHFDATVFVDEPHGKTMRRRMVETHEEDYVPKKDLVVTSPASEPLLALRGDDGVAMRVVVGGDTTAEPLTHLVIAFDTSASRATGFARRVRRLGTLISALSMQHPALTIEVLAFDQGVESMFEGEAADFGAPQREALLSRGALGASDPGRMFESLASTPPGRLLLVTDGVATSGQSELLDLRADLETLERGGLRRLDVVLDTAGGSDTLLKDLVRGRLPEDGSINRADRPAEELAKRIGRSLLAPISVHVEGAKSVWPTEIRGAQPGDAVMLYAHGVPKGPVAAQLRGGVFQDLEVPTIPVPGPLISRAMAASRIDALTAEHSAEADPTQKDELRKRIVDLSRDNRVISDFTAMLVLETESDYRRFDIDRDAVVDILVVGDDGAGRVPRSRSTPKTAHISEPMIDDVAREAGILGVLARGSGHFLASPYGAAFAVGDDDEDVWGGLTGSSVAEAYGVGDLGLVGTGYGGGGTGEGTIGLGNVGLIGRGGGGASGSGFGRGVGFATRRRFVPRVRIMTPQVQRGMRKDYVRRIARAHVNELRYCYLQALERAPDLSGKIDVDFTIAGTGKVITAKASHGTLRDDMLDSCVQGSIARWKFPKPSSKDTVDVSMAFTFSRTERPPPAPPPDPVAPIAWRPKAPHESNSPVEDLAQVDAALTLPHEGKMLEVSTALEQGDPGGALAKARAWRRKAPQDVMALIALGQAYEATGLRSDAARAYGSLIDMFPSDAPMLRHASARLTALGGEEGLTLARDAARQAYEERPDHPSSHRTYAWALVAMQEYEQAFGLLRDAAARGFAVRYEGVNQILRDDAAVVAAKWASDVPNQAKEIRALAKKARIRVLTKPVTHFVLSWETDANDVDLHVYDRDGSHAYYLRRGLDSGGFLYADVVDGYGPESFTIEGEPKGYPYRVDVDYFSRGPMGYGLGALQIIQTGKTQETETIPFVLMMEKGRARLKLMKGPLAQDAG